MSGVDFGVNRRVIWDNFEGVSGDDFEFTRCLGVTLRAKVGAIVGLLRAGFGGGNESDFEGVCHHTWGCLWGMLPVDVGGGEFVG